MKKITKFQLFIALLFASSIYGQDLKSPRNQYLQDMKADTILFNEKMLNILFANKVGTAFSGSSDLSLQKFYTSLDVNDSSLSIGANFDKRGDDEMKKLSFIFSGGLKIKSKDKFATVYKNGDFQEDNIGATFKFSYIGDGLIDFTSPKDLKGAIKKNREYLFKKYDEKTAKFSKEEIENLNITGDDLYIALAKEEIEYIEKNKLYNFVSDRWLSFEVFVPFGENSYKTTNDVLNESLKDRNFYAFNATLSGNYMREYASGKSIFFKAKLNLKNNNNIIVDDLTATPFQTTTIGAGGTTVVTNSDDGYVTDFNQFLTTSLTIEPAFFILKNTVGFSPAIELNQGKYNKTNWKLGIPISLKDKDGKAKVNFEIQWKEINTFNSSIHLVGISANFLFGELIN